MGVWVLRGVQIKGVLKTVRCKFHLGLADVDWFECDLNLLVVLTDVRSQRAGDQDEYVFGLGLGGVLCLRHLCLALPILSHLSPRDDVEFYSQALGAP